MYWKTNAFLFFLPKQLQFVEQVTGKTFLWSIKAPFKSENSDQKMSLDADGNESHRVTPYPVTARKPS